METSAATWGGRPFRPVLVLLALCLPGCAAHFPPLVLEPLSPRGDSGDQPWEYLLDEAELVADLHGGEVVVTERVHTQQRLTRPGTIPDVYASYDGDLVEFVSLRARSVLPDGSSHDLDEVDRVDSPFEDEGVLYSGFRRIHWKVPPLPVGGVVEHEAVSRRRGGARLWHEGFLLGETRTHLARLSISTPDGVEVEWADLGPAAGRLTPVTSHRDGRTVLVFEGRDLPGLRRDPEGPPTWQLVQHVVLRISKWPGRGGPQVAFATPQAHSSWLGGLYAPRLEPSAEMRTTVAQLLRGVPDEPLAKSRTLYEYVSRGVRYCAVELGHGGYVPHPASEVHRLRAGDCKDKAAYLVALLSLAGVRATPVMLHAHGGFPRPVNQLEQVGAFNHVIVAVQLPSGTVFADPTSSSLPFGVLPWQDADVEGLPIAPGGAPLTHTPATRAEENVVREDYRLALSAAGTLQGSVTVTQRGLPAVQTGTALRAGERKPRDVVDALLTLRQRTLADVQPFSVPEFAGETALGGRVETTAVVRSPGSSVLVLRSDALLDSLEPEIPLPRHSAWAKPFLDTRATSLSIALPPQARVDQVPGEQRLESRFGCFQLGWTLDAGVLRLTRELAWAARVIDVGELEALQGFLRSIRLAESGAVVVRLAETP